MLSIRRCDRGIRVSITAGTLLIARHANHGWQRRQARNFRIATPK